MNAILSILGSLINFYMIIISIRILMGWFSGVRYGGAYHLLSRITDPYLAWFRRFTFLRTSMFDFSPVAALAALSVLNITLATVNRRGRIGVGIILGIVLSVASSAAGFLLAFCIIILILRLIAYLTNRNIYGTFWRAVDLLSQPILYRIIRILFRGRFVPYLKSLLWAIAALTVFSVGLGLLCSIAANILFQLPF